MWNVVDKSKPYPQELPDPWWARLAGILTAGAIFSIIGGLATGVLAWSAVGVRRALEAWGLL